MRFFQKGGPVMWPILTLSVLGLAILFWKALEFRAGRRDGRGLTVVSTIITAEPMLGILGTVTGIIRTFAALDGAGGVVNPLAALGLAPRVRQLDLHPAMHRHVEDAVDEEHEDEEHDVQKRRQLESRLSAAPHSSTLSARML